MAMINMISANAAQLSVALDQSPMAFAYFDMSDRLRYWNRAYEDLNYRIKPRIREGAYFPELLDELVCRGQIDIPDGNSKAWIAHRLEQRRIGGLDFRQLSDGRTFLCQERHDETGGTLGIWIDVTHLFGSDHLGILEAAVGSPQVDFYDPGCQNSMREHLQTILGALELLRATEQCPENALLVDQGLEAAEAMAMALDMARARGGREAAELSYQR
ncbi:MAG: PAS-domain containing protein [Pseudomonadota bacterium]